MKDACLADGARVGGSERKLSTWGMVWALCVLVVGSVLGWLLDDHFRSRYVHREFHGTELAGKDLRRMYLRWSDLSGAVLAGTDLRGADLSGTVLFGADFTGARLEGVKLARAAYDRTTLWPSGFNPAAQGARLLVSGSNCSGVRLPLCELANLDLRGADLQRADLAHSRLLGTDLRNADLRGAYLWGTDLSRVRLVGAKLAGAEYTSATRWPPGFDPRRLGARLVSR